MIYLLQTKHYALGFQGFPNLFIIYNIFVLYQEEYTVFNRIQPKITVGHMWDTFVAGYKGSLSYLLQTTRVPLHYALGFQCFQILFIIYNIFCIIPRRIYIKYYICYRLQGFPLALCFGFPNLFIIYNIFVLYQEEYILNSIFVIDYNGFHQHYALGFQIYLSYIIFLYYTKKNIQYLTVSNRK